MGAPDIRPVGDLPSVLSETTALPLHYAGISSRTGAAGHTETELLAAYHEGAGEASH